jgi:hypothetical protein
MKRYVLALIFSLMLLPAVCQTVAKKPSLMVVPSRNWCKENNFMTEYDNMGTKVLIPDYQKAFDSSNELNLVVAKIGQMMSDRGFDLRLMASALQTLQQEAAEDMMLASKATGAGVEETPIDKLKKVAKADIWLEVYWLKNNAGLKTSLTFNLSGVDAYTDEQIANCQGTGQPSYSTEIPVLLEEAVTMNLDNFNEQLMNKFNDWFANGRQIKVQIKRWADAEHDLESEFGGKELGELIEDWVRANTVKGQFTTDTATENMMVFSNVRIPMVNEQGTALDARRWGRGLQKMLRDKYTITAKVMTKGLGQVTLVIGGK